jgi:hypothetical protein
VTRLRRVLPRLSPQDGRPAIATLDDALWERVGRLLVARGRLGQRELDSALAEYRRSRVPLDDVLVKRGFVSRQAVASAMLLVQVGDELQDRIKERRQPPRAEVEAFPDVPCEPVRTFALACFAVDALVFGGAAVVAALARSSSRVPLPPVGWMALFGALSLGLYWAWRAPMLKTTLRPWADALIVAGSTSLAATTVLAIRSLTGKTGVAEDLLPLWAFASVYGVAGRLAFYLAWPPRAEAPEQETGEPRPRRRIEPVPEPAPKRTLEVVPLRPDISAALDELLAEIDVLVRERAAS